MILFAHHVELQHLPVLAIFLGVGIWLGWRATSRLLTWTRSSSSTPAPEEKGQAS
jgi:hypothetical protein